MGTNWPWNWIILTVLKTIKMTVRADCVISACSSLPLSIQPWNSPLKALAHWLSGGRWPLDTSLPSTLVASLRNKANFPFHQHCLSSIGFRGAASSRTQLSVTKTTYLPHNLTLGTTHKASCFIITYISPPVRASFIENWYSNVMCLMFDTIEENWYLLLLIQTFLCKFLLGTSNLIYKATNFLKL